MDSINKLIDLEKRASKFGFCWESAEQILIQMESEIVEVKEHLNTESINKQTNALKEEIGDLFHCVISLCVFCNLNPQEVLSKTNRKFQNRLQAVEEIAKEKGLSDLKNSNLDQLTIIWQEAKKRVKKSEH